MPSMGGSGGGKGGGLKPSDQWCNEQAGVLARMKIDKGVIGSEFKVADLESLQDEFQKAFRRANISKTFPNAKFFQASFETAKVRAIYDNFLAFPEPDTLAALIQLSRANDQQERSDALMALVFLHLQCRVTLPPFVQSNFQMESTLWCLVHALTITRVTACVAWHTVFALPRPPA